MVFNPGDHLPLLLDKYGKVHEHGVDFGDALLQLLDIFVSESYGIITAFGFGTNCPFTYFQPWPTVLSLEQFPV